MFEYRNRTLQNFQMLGRYGCKEDEFVGQIAYQYIFDNICENKPRTCAQQLELLFDTCIVALQWLTRKKI